MCVYTWSRALLSLIVDLFFCGLQTSLAHTRNIWVETVPSDTQCLDFGVGTPAVVYVVDLNRQQMVSSPRAALTRMSFWVRLLRNANESMDKKNNKDEKKRTGEGSVWETKHKLMCVWVEVSGALLRQDATIPQLRSRIWEPGFYLPSFQSQGLILCH